MKSLSQKQKKILQIAAVPVAYLFSLVLFVRLTFPYETLRDRVLAEFNTSQKERRLEIDQMGGSGIFGVSVEGARLINLDQSDTLGSEEGTTKAQTISVDRASVSVSALSYLFGTVSASFDAEIGGGEIEGTFKQNDEEARIEVKGADVDISGLTLLSSAVGLPLGGELSGSVQLLLPEGQMKKAEGSFALQVQDLTAGDGKAKVRDTIALPQLRAGNLVFKAEATEGRLQISEFSTTGPDFEMTAQGQLRLKDPFDKSIVGVDVTFQFKEAYTNKSDLTRGIFGSPDSKIPALFDMDPTVRRAKKPDGSYSWQVSGLLSKPTFRPGRSRASANVKDQAENDD